MSTEMLSTRIDLPTKQAFTQICDSLGISPSQALKLFAKAVVNYGGIPFELRTPQPNATTVAAMKELLDGKGPRVETVEELLAQVAENKANYVAD